MTDHNATSVQSPMERELLSYVQQLTETLEHSQSVLTDLEKRSTGLLNKRLDNLQACLSASINSQAQFNAVLINLLTEPSNFEEHAKSLSETMTLAQSIQKKLNRNVE